MLRQNSSIFSTGALKSIKARFAALVVGAALVSCAAVGVLSYQIGKTGLLPPTSPPRRFPLRPPRSLA